MVQFHMGTNYKESAAKNKKEAKTRSFRLPGWGRCYFQTLWGGTAAPALPGRPASHSRFATAITKETHHQRACLSGFLTPATAGVNQKTTIIRFCKGDAANQCDPSATESPELCWRAKWGHTASADSGIRAPGDGVVSILRKAAGEEDRQAGYLPKKLRRRCGPARVGHHYGQYRQAKRLRAVRRRQNLIAEPKPPCCRTIP